MYLDLVMQGSAYANCPICSSNVPLALLESHVAACLLRPAGAGNRQRGEAAETASLPGATSSAARQAAELLQQPDLADKQQLRANQATNLMPVATRAPALGAPEPLQVPTAPANQQSEAKNMRATIASAANLGAGPAAQVEPRPSRANAFARLMQEQRERSRVHYFFLGRREDDGSYYYHWCDARGTSFGYRC